MNLQESIRMYGILHPLVVKSCGNGKYKLIDGQRRLSCISDDRTLIPCTVIGEKGVQLIPKKLITQGEKMTVVKLQNKLKFLILTDVIEMVNETGISLNDFVEFAFAKSDDILNMEVLDKICSYLNLELGPCQKQKN